MAIVEVDEEHFQEEMKDAFEKKNIVILKFGSEYCESCHALECELEEIDEMFGSVSVFSIDTDESPEIAEQYNVYALPTMVIYEDSNRIIYNDSGVILAQEIEQIIKNKER
jgi:thioredoxin-like negative regulator of GroEL